MKTVVNMLIVSGFIVFSRTTYAMVNESAMTTVKLGNSPVAKQAACSVYAEVKQKAERKSQSRSSNKLEGFGIDDVESYSRDSSIKLTGL